MKLIKLLCISIGLFAISTALADAQPKLYNGSFLGELTPSGCRSDQLIPISGSIMNGRVKIKLVRGESLDVKISENGEFEGEAFLRPHRHGDKMQSYEGKVRGDKIIINATFGVPGYPQTQCTAGGEMPLLK